MNLGSLVRPATEADPNAFRFRDQHGHVESYFLRLNHPTRPLALWLKATVFAPLEGAAVAETWLIWFDGEKNETLAHRDTQPLETARFEPGDGGVDVHAGTFDLRLAPRGHARGSVDDAKGKVRFDLSFSADESKVAEPLSLFRWRALREGPLPRLKFNTPSPWLHFQGVVELPWAKVKVDGWDGMQGHNWGTEHPPEYAWGQCVFPGTAGAPATMVEAGTGRVKLAGRDSPRLSLMTVRRGERVFRFDRLLDTWNQSVTVTPNRWTVRLWGKDGEARLRMDGRGRPMACLGYRSPNGRVSYCFNTKLADVLLEVRPKDGPAFTCKSAHGGALEFLRNEPDPSLPVV